MKTLISILVIATTLVACGGSSKSSTTPSNKTDVKPGATGGQTYGTPAPTTDAHDGTQPPMPDPCAAP